VAAASLELRPESIAFFARVGAFLTKRKASEAVYETLRVSETATAAYLEDLEDVESCSLQPEGATIESIYAAAAEARRPFSDALDRCVLGVTKVTKLMQTHCKVASLKLVERVREKIANEYSEYGDPARRVKDVLRAAIYVEALNGIVVAVDQIVANLEVVRVKNRFGRPTFCGFRDVLLNVKVEVGSTFVIAEIQVHLIKLSELARASRSHDHYAYFREYFLGNEASSVAARMAVLEKWHSGSAVDARVVLDLCARKPLDAASFADLRAVMVLLKQMCEVALAAKVAAALADAEAPGARDVYRPANHALLLLDVADLAVRGGDYGGTQYAAVGIALAKAPRTSDSVLAASVAAGARAGAAGAARLRGDHASACRLAREAVAEVGSGDVLGRCAALNTLAAALAAFADEETRRCAEARGDDRATAGKKAAGRGKAAKRYAEAVGHLREILGVYDALGPVYEDRASACATNLAAALEASGGDAALREALALAEAAVAQRTRQSGAACVELAALRNNLGTIRDRLGDSLGAVADLGASLALTKTLLGARHPAVARRAGNLGLVLQRAGRLDEAEPHMARALAVARENGDPYADRAEENLRLLRRERAGAAVVNRGGTVDARAGTVLSRDENQDFVDTIEAVDFSVDAATGAPGGGAALVAKLNGNKAALLKRDVRTTFAPREHYVVFAVHNTSLAELDFTMDFSRSSGATLRGSDGLVAKATVPPATVLPVAYLRLEEKYALTFKIACATRTMRPARAKAPAAPGRPRSGTRGAAAPKTPAAPPGRPGRPSRTSRSATSKGAAAPDTIASLYAGLE